MQTIKKRPIPSLWPEHWAGAIKASESPGSLYTYGSTIIKNDIQKFFDSGKHLIKERTQDYQPNPYIHQYDLEIHLFLNYYRLIARELISIKEELKDKISPGRREELLLKHKDIEKNGVTGAPRVTHLIHACEIRWPTYIEEDGRHMGQMVRTPWMELILGEISRISNVVVYGGGGQGKTHIFAGILICLFDHFQQTLMGAQCSFSTINKIKMERVTWPRIQRLYENGAKNISLYAGTGRVGGDFTIYRANTRSTGSVLRGILVGASATDHKVIDKLTGVHGHDLYAYLIDEMQSTKPAPIEASANFLMTAPKDKGFLWGSGNWGNDSDQLAKNTIPIHGWGSVDFENGTTVYESYNITGALTSCIWLSNEDSPAMSPEGALKWGHMLPTLQKKKDRYADEERAKRTDAFQRFWVGRRSFSDDPETFCSVNLIEEGNCDRKAVFSGPVKTYGSFDSAHAGKDRSPLLTATDGIDSVTGKRVIQFEKFRAIYTEGGNLKYHSETTDTIIDYMDQDGVSKTRSIAIDWTNLSSFPEMFLERGWEVYPVRYNLALPGYRTRGALKGSEKDPILLNYEEDKQGNVIEKWAHEECSNYITLGAFALRYLLKTGRICNFSNDLFSDLSASEYRTFEEEFCMRRMEEIPNSKYGTRMALQDKKKFRKDMGFSSDYLDTILQLMVMVFIEKEFNPFLLDNPLGPKVPGRGRNEKNTFLLDGLEEDDFHKNRMNFIWSR